MVFFSNPYRFLVLVVASLILLFSIAFNLRSGGGIEAEVPVVDSSKDSAKVFDVASHEALSLIHI